jgi:hypothetical protein
MKVEAESLILTITSPDFTEGEWRHEQYGDDLLERGQGWQLEAVFALSAEDVLDGIGDSPAISPEPTLVYQSHTYVWPDASTIERDLTLADLVELLGVLTTGSFPHAFFDEDASEL